MVKNISPKLKQFLKGMGFWRWCGSPLSPRRPKQEEALLQNDSASKSKTSEKKKDPLEKKIGSTQTKEIKVWKTLKKMQTFLSPRRWRKGRRQMETAERKGPNWRMDSLMRTQTQTPMALLVMKVAARQQRKHPWDRKKDLSPVFLCLKRLELLKARRCTSYFLFKSRHLCRFNCPGVDRNWEDIPLFYPFGWEPLRWATDRKRGPAPQMLILVPTRQSAKQVSKDISDITKKLSVACFLVGFISWLGPWVVIKTTCRIES